MRRGSPLAELSLLPTLRLVTRRPPFSQPVRWLTQLESRLLSRLEPRLSPQLAERVSSRACGRRMRQVQLGQPQQRPVLLGLPKQPGERR